VSISPLKLCQLFGAQDHLQEAKDEGTHIWKLRHFSKPAYCNICLTLLVAWGGKQGLSCSRKCRLHLFLLPWTALSTITSIDQAATSGEPALNGHSNTCLPTDLLCLPIFSVCKYTVHERCVQKAPNNCVSTYAKSRRSNQKMVHHWVEGNCADRCHKCKKSVKMFEGKHCRWCQTTVRHLPAINATRCRTDS
jgi:diacylglycerol kinase (ATP)